MDNEPKNGAREEALNAGKREPGHMRQRKEENSGNSDWPQCSRVAYNSQIMTLAWMPACKIHNWAALATSENGVSSKTPRLMSCNFIYSRDMLKSCVQIRFFGTENHISSAPGNQALWTKRSREYFVKWIIKPLPLALSSFLCVRLSSRFVYCIYRHAWYACS